MALLILLLPVFLAGATALYGVYGFIEDGASARNGCRRELARGLEKMAVPLEALLALNPQAAQLRAQHQMALALLASALASGNPAAVAKATRQVQRIEKARSLLDKTQKKFLTTAQRILQLAQLQARRALSKAPIGFVRVRTLESSPARVAVRPDAPGPAPIYVLEESFETRQALVQKWQSHFLIRGPLQNFLRSQGRFKNLCAITLERQNSRFRAKIIEDRFSWKLSSY